MYLPIYCTAPYIIYYNIILYTYDISLFIKVYSCWVPNYIEAVRMYRGMTFTKTSKMKMNNNNIIRTAHDGSFRIVQVTRVTDIFALVTSKDFQNTWHGYRTRTIVDKYWRFKFNVASGNTYFPSSERLCRSAFRCRYLTHTSNKNTQSTQSMQSRTVHSSSVMGCI